jgi:DNA-binding LacI/PurR family transcriptional regulator
MARVWRGLALAAERLGVRLTTLLAPEVTPGIIKKLSQQRPLGVICLSDSVASGQALVLARAAWSAEIPVVAMGDWVQPQELNLWPADLIFTSHAQGTRDLVHWLHAKGARKPWLLGLRTVSNSFSTIWRAERQAGFKTACTELGLPIPPHCMPLEDPHFRYVRESLYEQARIFAGYLIDPLAEGADAFLCANDVPAFSMAKALHLLGRIPNRDVLLAGFDNNHLVVPTDFWSLAGGGALVTYDKFDSSVGEKLLDVLMQRRQHDLPSSPQRITLPGKLIEMNPESARSTLQR